MVPGHEQAVARLTPDGVLELRIGVQTHGQGLETTLAQVAHEVLGIDPGARPPGARRHGADALFHRHLGLALHGDGGRRGRHGVPRARRSASHASARSCWRSPARTRCASATALVERPGWQRDDRGGRAHLVPRAAGPAARRRPARARSDRRLQAAKRDTGTFSYAAMPRWLRSTPNSATSRSSTTSIVEDGGTLVNPMIVDGQVIGGAAQGIGTALYEEMPFDAAGPAARARRSPTTCCRARPKCRRSASMHMRDARRRYTEFGQKGIGEGGAIGPPAAIANAVNDALRAARRGDHRLPITPRRIARGHCRRRRCRMKACGVRLRAAGERRRGASRCWPQGDDARACWPAGSRSGRC